MGYYSTIEFDQRKFKNIKRKENLFKLLNQEEKDFLNKWYEDLEIEGGFIELNEWNRKNYESENWITILMKIAEHEKEGISVFFTGEDRDRWGYKCNEKGECFEMEEKRVWNKI